MSFIRKTLKIFNISLSLCQLTQFPHYKVFNLYAGFSLVFIAFTKRMFIFLTFWSNVMSKAFVQKSPFVENNIPEQNFILCFMRIDGFFCPDRLNSKSHFTLHIRLYTYAQKSFLQFFL